MIENRLELNKRNKRFDYKINELETKEYRKNVQTPNFEPDLAMCSWGDIKECSPSTWTKEVWFKTSNKNLLSFIRNYDWNSLTIYKNSANSLPSYVFKKIILEEFYGVKNDRE